jgi:prokaryotic ubiquitin-like protein Pup
MTSRDSAGAGGQERASRRSEETDVEPDVADAGAAPSGAVAERKAALDEDVDAMLDEIDEVLETNAEEFVRGFVQKGGE